MNDHNNEDYFVKRSVPQFKDTTEKTGTERISSDRKKTKAADNLPEKSEGVASVAESNTDKFKFLKIPSSYKTGNVDMVFLVILALLLAIGIVMSFSASYAYAAKKYGDSYYFVVRQLLFTVLGVIAILMVTLFPLKTYKIVTYIVFGVAIILLLLVLVAGSERGGAKRWLEIPGPGSFQPSELAKTALVMMLAMYMSRFGDEVQAPGFKKSFL